MVRRLCAIDHIDPLGGHVVTAGLLRGLPAVATFTPQVAHLASENRAVAADARIESPAVDQAVAVVAQRTLHADAKADRPLPRAEGAAFDSPHAHAHVEGACALPELAGEHVDAAIGRGIRALDAALRDPPVLKRIRPVVLPKPHAVRARVPIAAELRDRLRRIDT